MILLRSPILRPLSACEELLLHTYRVPCVLFCPYLKTFSMLLQVPEAHHGVNEQAINIQLHSL
jgi:hypothetical protein